MTKSLDTLVEDVYNLFDKDTDHVVNEENIETLQENIANLMRRRLGKQNRDASPLRFSNLGKQNRQIWYQSRDQDTLKVEEMSPKTLFKFMYGDIIEEMILFLIKEAGHTVEKEQAEVEVEGVKGHIDAIIDGVVVDVKSASPFGYQKFKTGKLFEDDAFGYIDQLSGYNNVLNPGKPAAFIAFDKVAGDICILEIPPSISKDYQPVDRIRELKDVISSEQPPKRCYEPKPEGKSGNMALSVGCSYCSYKHECWPELRTFLYSNGPKFLTKVVKRPRENIYEVPK